MTLMDLTGKVALITGGNGGIGLGMAQGLADAGATVVLAGRDQAKATAALAALAAAGTASGRPPAAHFIAADITGKAACEAMVAATLALAGRLDILVINAGMSIRKPPEAFTEADWRAVLDTNLSGAFFCAQAAHPPMRQIGGGKIITIGSMMSLFGAPFAAAYGASKGGIVQLTRALAVAWAADNIQVNAVLPGWIDTDLTRDARRQVAGLQDRVLARTPAGRWGRPADLAGIAVFLASAGSDYVTGTAIPVDGGYSVST